MATRNLKIVSAQLTIELSDGTLIDVPVSTAMLEAIQRATGLVMHDLGNDKFASYRFDDETIDREILPLLPKLS